MGRRMESRDYFASSQGLSAQGLPPQGSRLVGANIRRRRFQCKISDDVMMAQLACNRQYLKAIEEGQVRLRAGVLFDLAELLQCTIADFFERPPPADRGQDRDGAAPVPPSHS